MNSYRLLYAALLAIAAVEKAKKESATVTTRGRACQMKLTNNHLALVESQKITECLQ